MATILIVEDNDLNRDMLTRRLARKGYDVVTAKDGAEGLRMATERPPDLILMDLSLPIMDGWEATRRLKARPTTCEIPIVVLTAHVMEADRQLSHIAGCDGFATKPVDLPALVSTIEALLADEADA